MGSIPFITETEFQQAVLDSSIPVIVDFSTDGCGPCEVIVPVLQAVQTKLSGRLKIVQHNVTYQELLEDSNELVKKYDVMGFPTLFLFKDGELVERIIGSYEEDFIINTFLAAL